MRRGQAFPPARLAAGVFRGPCGCCIRNSGQAGDLFPRDEGCQSGEGVQWREPFRSGCVQVGVLRSAKIISEDAGVTVVMEAGEKGA
jgi:hypothetical protein